MKKGAPRKAVTIPSGSSAGATTVRASTSAAMRSAAPSSAEPGRTIRWSGLSPSLRGAGLSDDLSRCQRPERNGSAWMTRSGAPRTMGMIAPQIEGT